MAAFIIAEAGVNHNGDINQAKRLIDAAKKACCNAVKFQTYKTERLVTKTALKAEYQINNTGVDEPQYKMLERLELSFEDHVELIKYCREKDIVFISTPFDEESADMLERLGMKIFKIPSGEITNKHLLKHIAKKRKPVILSTGMATLGEVEEALQWIYEEGNSNVCLLHCTSCYPTLYEDVNLKAMQTLKDAFKIKVGYSDHTPGIEVPVAAVSLGAEVIEKHITLDRNMEGPDHKASLEPEELLQMVKCIRNVEKALGNGIKKPVMQEIKMKEAARRYIVTKRQVFRGQTITSDMLDFKRAGKGFLPKEIESIVGSIAAKDLPEEHILEKSDFCL